MNLVTAGRDRPSRQLRCASAVVKTGCMIRVEVFYDVNRESRAAIQRSGVHLADAFKIGDFDTTSTISWALEKCSEETELILNEMAREWKLRIASIFAR